MSSAIIAFTTGSADNYRYSYLQLLVMLAVFILIIAENIEYNQLSIKFKKIASLSAVVLPVLVAIKSHHYNELRPYKETIYNIA